MNKALRAFLEDLPINVAVLVLLAATLWRGSAAAALGAVVLVIFQSQRPAIEKIVQVVTAELEKLRTGSNDAANDAKLKAIVESLNKLHANDKVFDERMDAFLKRLNDSTDELGKVKLRLAIKPLEDAGIGV